MDTGGPEPPAASRGGPPGRLRSGGTQATLDDGTTAAPAQFGTLPGMRVLGQLHDTYVVAETADGLLLIDQHAADERVRYERLRARFDGEPQALVEPITLELTAREAAALPAIEPALRDLGFRADHAGDRHVQVTAVPAVLDAVLDPGRIRDAVLELLADRDGDAAVGADAVLADLACAPAIAGNTSLTEGSVRDLLVALDACEDPYACPHGRPVLVELDGDELDARFERDYPGHAHRRDP